MKLKLIISLFFLIFFISLSLFSQQEDTNLGNINIRKHLPTLNRRISLLIKKDYYLNKIKDKLSIFHVFYISIEDKNICNFLITKSRFDSVIPNYYNVGNFLSRNKLLETETYVYDLSGKIVAKGDVRKLYLAKKYNGLIDTFDRELMEILISKQADFIYRIGINNKVSYDYYLASKGNNYFILKVSKNGLEKISIEDFFKCGLVNMNKE